MSEHSSEHHISIRVNTLKITPALCRSKISEAFPDCSIDSVSWYENALVVRGIPRAVFLESPLVSDGLCYPQGLASMLPVLVLDPQPEELILDMCAAPGSKTTQLAAHMRNTGEIVANDASRTRLYKLATVAEMLGATNITTHIGKGEFLWRRYADTFDRVLVDAPCSMDQPLSGKQIKALARQQTYLLRSALACVKPGGRVVYSTCTHTREENEAVIEYVIAKMPEAIIEPIGVSSMPQEWSTSEGYVRVQKNTEIESFFIACMVRGVEEKEV